MTETPTLPAPPALVMFIPDDYRAAPVLFRMRSLKDGTRELRWRDDGHWFPALVSGIYVEI